MGRAPNSVVLTWIVVAGMWLALPVGVILIAYLLDLRCT